VLIIVLLHVAGSEDPKGIHTRAGADGVPVVGANKYLLIQLVDERFKSFFMQFA
jgi:hypothetical protein